MQQPDNTLPLILTLLFLSLLSRKDMCNTLQLGASRGEHACSSWAAENELPLLLS